MPSNISWFVTISVLYCYFSRAYIIWIALKRVDYDSEIFISEIGYFRDIAVLRKWRNANNLKITLNSVFVPPLLAGIQISHHH